jgi:hypothetical protein
MGPGFPVDRKREREKREYSFLNKFMIIYAPQKVNRLRGQFTNCSQGVQNSFKKPP